MPKALKYLDISIFHAHVAQRLLRSPAERLFLGSSPSVRFSARQMTEIVKKIYSDMFQAIIDGKKKFELRLADQNYQEGDILVLKEIDKNRNFTGREISKKITFVIKTKDLSYFKQEDIDKYGYAILSLE